MEPEELRWQVWWLYLGAWWGPKLKNHYSIEGPLGGHTAALQFMPCIQFPIGEGKHAIRSRGLHEDEIVTVSTAGNSTEMVLICLYFELPKHVLHEPSLLKYRVRRAFLHKMKPDAMQKVRNVTSEPCDKAADAKCSIRIGAINEKYTSFH